MGWSDKIKFFLFFIFTGVSGLFSQTPQIDSLQILLDNYVANDTTRVNLLYELGAQIPNDKSLLLALEAEKLSMQLNFEKGLGESYYLYACYYWKKSDYDTLQYYLEKSVAIFEKTHFKLGSARCYNLFGVVYKSKGDFNKALDNYQKSLQINKTLGNKPEVAKAFNAIGLLFKLMGDYGTAIEYFEKSSKLKEEIGDQLGLAKTINNIGTIYKNLGDYNKALGYYRKSLQIRAELGDSVGMANCWGNMGASYKLQEKYDTALFYLQKTMEMYRKKGSGTNFFEAFAHLGDVYRAKHDDDKALAYYQEALAYCLSIKSKACQVNALNKLGEWYNYKQNFPEVIKHAGEAYELAVSIDYPEGQKASTSLLYKSYKNIGAYKAALQFHERYKNVCDSLYGRETISKIKEIEMSNQYEKEKLLTAKALEMKDVLISKKQQQVHLLGIILLVVILAVFVFSYYYRQIKIKNKKLFQQTYELASIEKGEDQKKDKKPISIVLETEKDILRQIEHLMHVEKLFKNPAVTLDSLAITLNTNRTYLSRVINDNFQCNFNKFINTYRIKEARKMLSDQAFHHLTFEAIANEVGFNSRSTFNMAFKEFTGITPSYFKTSIEKEHLVEV